MIPLVHRRIRYSNFHNLVLCLFVFEPVITSAVSALDGALSPGLLQVGCWCAITISALEGNLSPGLSPIWSCCIIQHESEEHLRKTICPHKPFPQARAGPKTLSPDTGLCMVRNYGIPPGSGQNLCGGTTPSPVAMNAIIPFHTLSSQFAKTSAALRRTKTHTGMGCLLLRWIHDPKLLQLAASDAD